MLYVLRKYNQSCYNMIKGVVAMAIKCYLSRALGERRINISEFSKSAGVARNTITSLYHEEAKGITWGVLDKICTALNCQPNDLIEHIPNENKEVTKTEELSYAKKI